MARRLEHVLSFKIPHDLWQYLHDLAEKKDRSIAGVVRVLLRQAMENRDDLVC
jgi:hypothetical protein